MISGTFWGHPAENCLQRLADVLHNAFERKSFRTKKVRSKFVTHFSLENLDEIICLLSDKIQSYLPVRLEKEILQNMMRNAIQICIRAVGRKYERVEQKRTSRLRNNLYLWVTKQNKLAPMRAAQTSTVKSVTLWPSTVILTPALTLPSSNLVQMERSR